MCHRRFYLDDAASARVYYPLDSITALTDDFAPYVDGVAHTVTVATDEDDDGVCETAWDATDFEFYPWNRLANAQRPAMGVSAFRYGNRWFCNGRRVSVTARWGWASV